MNIAVIIGSTRPGRFGESVGQWVYEQAATREGATYELVDLADFDLPLLSEPTVPGAANGTYEVPQTRAWAEVIKKYDGYVFVTPEYNHSVPAAMKNAFDVLFVEWKHKAVTFVGYGSADGVRSIEHWRTIVANAFMHATRRQVGLSTFADAADGALAPQARRADELDATLTELEALTEATASLRA